MTACRQPAATVLVLLVANFATSHGYAQVQSAASASPPNGASTAATPPAPVAPVASTYVPVPVAPVPPYSTAPQLSTHYASPVTAPVAPNASVQATPYATTAMQANVMPAQSPSNYPGYYPTQPVVSAPAPSVNDERAQPVRPMNWSIGAGVTFGDTTLSNLGGYNGFGLEAPTMRSSVFLERRLTKHVYFLFQPDFYYSGNHREPGVVMTMTVVRATSFAVASGVRWVGNPGDTVELGMTHLLAAEFYDQTASGPSYRPETGTNSNQTTANTFAYSVGLTTGVAAEHQLMTQLWLRVHVSLVQISFAQQRIKYYDEGGSSSTSKSSVFNVAMSASPRLELRLTW